MRLLLLQDRGATPAAEMLEQFVRQNTGFDGWGVLREGPGFVLLRVQNHYLLEFVKLAQPSWAEIMPPLSASVDRAPAALRQLAGTKLRADAKTVRDLVADLLDDDDFD